MFLRTFKKKKGAKFKKDEPQHANSCTETAHACDLSFQNSTNTCFLTSKTCFNVKRKRYIFEKQWRFEKCVILVYWAAKGEKEVS